jgi:hypothetical protein
VLHELRGGQARADALQQVVVEREQGAAGAEARVRAHTEREQEGAELAVGEGGEVAVVVVLSGVRRRKFIAKRS